MPAAYSPSKEGLDYDEAVNLFKMILSDKRVKAIEVTEFTPQKGSGEGTSASVIVDLICLLTKDRV
jgi:arginase family enzyme